MGWALLRGAGEADVPARLGGAASGRSSVGGRRTPTQRAWPKPAEGLAETAASDGLPDGLLCAGVAPGKRQAAPLATLGAVRGVQHSVWAARIRRTCGAAGRRGLCRASSGRPCGRSGAADRGRQRTAAGRGRRWRRGRKRVGGRRLGRRGSRSVPRSKRASFQPAAADAACLGGWVAVCSPGCGGGRRPVFGIHSALRRLKPRTSRCTRLFAKPPLKARPSCYGVHRGLLPLRTGVYDRKC